MQTKTTHPISSTALLFTCLDLPALQCRGSTQVWFWTKHHSQGLLPNRLHLHTADFQVQTLNFSLPQKPTSHCNTILFLYITASLKPFRPENRCASSFRPENRCASSCVVQASNCSNDCNPSNTFPELILHCICLLWVELWPPSPPKKIHV